MFSTGENVCHTGESTRAARVASAARLSGRAQRRSQCTQWSFVCALAQAYDQHLNMVLGDVEETVTTIELDEDTYEEIVRVRSW